MSTFPYPPLLRVLSGTSVSNPGVGCPDPRPFPAPSGPSPVPCVDHVYCRSTSDGTVATVTQVSALFARRSRKSTLWTPAVADSSRGGGGVDRGGVEGRESGGRLCRV